MREGIGRLQDAAEQPHDTFVAAAVPGNHESKAVAGVDQTIGEIFVLMLKVLREILQTVVAEVAVQLAVQRKILVVEGNVRRAGAFQMKWESDCWPISATAFSTTVSKLVVKATRARPATMSAPNTLLPTERETRSSESRALMYLRCLSLSPPKIFWK